MTLRSHFHYSRDALFGLWLQTIPSGLSNTDIPSHSSYTTHLYTTKNCMYDSKVAASTPVCCLTLCLNLATCFRASWFWTGAAHCSPHISASLWLLGEKTSFVAEKTVGRPGTLSLSRQVIWEYLLEGADTRNLSFSLMFLSHCPHPKDPALSPPGNPSETRPLLSRLAQETVADKRQKPSHKVNGKLKIGRASCRERV